MVQSPNMFRQDTFDFASVQKLSITASINTWVELQIHDVAATFIMLKYILYLVYLS